jgi:hypothetical protein
MWVRCTSLLSMISSHTTPIFVENSHERPFSKIPKANTYGFLPINCLHQKSKNVIYGQETYVGEVYEPLVYDQWPHNPYFVKNIMNNHFH